MYRVLAVKLIAQKVKQSATKLHGTPVEADSNWSLLQMRDADSGPKPRLWSTPDSAPLYSWLLFLIDLSGTGLNVKKVYSDVWSIPFPFRNFMGSKSPQFGCILYPRHICISVVLNCGNLSEIWNKLVEHWWSLYVSSNSVQFSPLNCESGIGDHRCHCSVNCRLFSLRIFHDDSDDGDDFDHD